MSPRPWRRMRTLVAGCEAGGGIIVRLRLEGKVFGVGRVPGIEVVVIRAQ